mmetsp:Transcript_26613/g.62384  ORF Transcript_26613/g.62384 Transcript_26613/m.62384 type:complete len:234 (+) Transcript_26613:877-1578(+)
MSSTANSTASSRVTWAVASARSANAPSSMTRMAPSGTALPVAGSASSRVIVATTAPRPRRSISSRESCRSCSSGPRATRDAPSRRDRTAPSSSSHLRMATPEQWCLTDRCTGSSSRSTRMGRCTSSPRTLRFHTARFRHRRGRGYQECHLTDSLTRSTVTLACHRTAQLLVASPTTRTRCLSISLDICSLCLECRWRTIRTRQATRTRCHRTTWATQATPVHHRVSTRTCPCR